MSRNRKHRVQTLAPLPQEQPVRPYNHVNRVSAGPCVMCPELLAVAGRQQRTRIYCSRGRIHFCKCENCHHTWKIVDGDPVLAVS